MGRVLDEDGNVVQASSSQGEAADVGNEVGNKIKDSIGLTLQTYSLYVCLMSSVMSTLYSSIHSWV